MEVRLCAESCIEDANSYSEREIHCCNDEACNESFPLLHKSKSLILPALVSLISLLLTIVSSYSL